MARTGDQGPDDTVAGTLDADKTAVHELPATLPPPPEAEPAASIICISGRSIGQIFVLGKDETTLGRAPECDIFLDDEGVSRHHAKIVREGDQLMLLDSNSTNGTFVDGERVEVVTLADGMRVQIGTATILQFRYQDADEVEFHALMQNFKTHDPLTEALNKRSFMSELEKEVGFARRHTQSLALVMFDLDHFKRVNDTYGHQAGDLVLRAVAQQVSEILRKEDAFGRFGGEEFAVLLRATTLENAFIVAERIRRLIENLQVSHNGRRIPCTASVGVAALDAAIQRAPDLVEAADDRLYQAKRKGRNRTEAPLFDT